MKLQLRIEYVYCFWSPQVPGIAKIGIATDVERRRQQVEMEVRSIFGDHVRVYTVVCMPILTNACAFETAIHRALRPLRSSMMRGTNGGTEWFRAVNPICCLLLGMLLWANGSERTVTASLVLLLVPIPLDFALYVVLLALAEYAAAVGLAFVVGRFLGVV